MKLAADSSIAYIIKMPAPKFNAELRTALQKIKLANQRLMSKPSDLSCETVNELKTAEIERTGDRNNVFNKLKS